MINYKNNIIIICSKIIFNILNIVITPLLLIVALVSRYIKKTTDVGIGPEPFINNIYHKKALEQSGYSAETFTFATNFITDEYDINLSSWKENIFTRVLSPYYLFVRSIFKYKCMFIYFNGGTFGCSFLHLLRYLEPIFYKIAGVKIVVMPYGSDIQVLERSKNPFFIHAMSMDYPNHYRKCFRRVRKNVDRWSYHADWVISGCEWVDYMYHWNTLMLLHFPIDMSRWEPAETGQKKDDGPLRILHAPNHTAIKGTQALYDAVEKLKTEGLDIELVILRGVPNTKIREVMESVDIVADQFVIGWYAMFALEAMSLKKPVLCYLREDLINLYVKAGLIDEGEIPIINTDFLKIEEKIRWAYDHRKELQTIGEKSRDFVRKHHSTERAARDFAEILGELGIQPSMKGLNDPEEGAS